MCESGKQGYEEKSCRAQVAQLKRLIWALMIWASILSLGLGASVTLHIISHQRPNTTTSLPTTVSPPNTESQLTSYNGVGMKEKQMQWRKTNAENITDAIEIEEDGNYFLFLRVTLASKPSENYTVKVIKVPKGNSPEDIIVHNINGKEMLTGFVGKGVHLTYKTQINVIINPKATIDYVNTQLGLIKF